MDMDMFKKKTTQLATSAGRSAEETETIIDMVLNFTGKAADFMAKLA